MKSSANCQEKANLTKKAIFISTVFFAVGLSCLGLASNALAVTDLYYISGDSNEDAYKNIAALFSDTSFVYSDIEAFPDTDATNVAILYPDDTTNVATIGIFPLTGGSPTSSFDLAAMTGESLYGGFRLSQYLNGTDQHVLAVGGDANTWNGIVDLNISTNLANFINTDALMSGVNPYTVAVVTNSALTIDGQTPTSLNPLIFFGHSNNQIGLIRADQSYYNFNFASLSISTGQLGLVADNVTGTLYASHYCGGDCSPYTISQITSAGVVTELHYGGNLITGNIQADAFGDLAFGRLSNNVYAAATFNDYVLNPPPSGGFVSFSTTSPFTLSIHSTTDTNTAALPNTAPVVGSFAPGIGANEFNQAVPELPSGLMGIIGVLMAGLVLQFRKLYRTPEAAL